MSEVIRISKGFSTIVDDEDFVFLSKMKWCAKLAIDYSRSGKVYVMRTEKLPDGNKKNVYIHRLLTGALDGQYVDHINGDTLDNRRSNLRVCTSGENSYNQSKRRINCTSKFKGVSWNTRLKKWVAQCGGPKTPGIKNQYIGCYDSELDAARAYNEAAIKRFGQFAKLNEGI